MKKLSFYFLAILVIFTMVDLKAQTTSRIKNSTRTLTQQVIKMQWAGKWNTSKGILTINQKGTSISGSMRSKGSLSGKIKGDNASGTYKVLKDSGTFNWKLSPDGKKFTGTSYSYTTRKRISWNGTITPVIQAPAITKPNVYQVQKPKTQIPKTNKILNRTVTTPMRTARMNKKFTLKDFVSKSKRTQKGNEEKLVVNNDDLELNVTSTPQGKPTVEKSETENCVTENSKVEVGTTAFKSFARGSTDQWLVAGNMFTSTSFLNGSYAPLPRLVKRNPITLFLRDIEPQNGIKSVVVQRPHAVSELFTATGTLKSQDVVEIPNQTVFGMKEIKNSQEFSYSITGKYSNKAAGIGVDLGLKSKDEQDGYYLLITFEQAMFNITVDDRTSDNIFTAAPSNAQDLVYISNVTYGRKGIMMVKTSKSFKSLGVNAGFTYNKGMDKASLNAQLSKISKDESATISMLYYGGDSEMTNMALGDFLKDEDGREKDVFGKWIKEANVRNKKGFLSKNALPIAYTLKNLKGEQLGLKSTFDKKNRTCIPNRSYRLKVNLDKIRSWVAEDRDNEDDYCIEFVPKLSIDGKNYPLQNRVFSLGKSKNEEYERSVNDLWAYNATYNQIPVKEKDQVLINNYGVFEIPKNVDLREAQIEIKFRVWEASGSDGKGKPKLNRLYGVSSLGGYNYHKLNVNELLQIMVGTRSLSSDKPDCGNSNGGCKKGKNGSYGYSKFNISKRLVPFTLDIAQPEFITIDEVMFNSSHTRKMVLSYSFELLPPLLNE